MAMTTQDFIALADAIRDHNDYVAARVATSTPTSHTPFADGQLDVLARFCAAQNRNFNRDRWLGYINGSNEPSGKVAR